MVKKGPKYIKTIYECFSEYSKEDIDIVIEGLSDDEKNIIKLRYGDDLQHPVASPEWNRKLSQKLYNVLFPRMRRHLNRIVSDKNISSKKVDDIDSKKIENNEPLVNVKSEFSKDDYVKTLELLKTPTFGEIMKFLTPKEAVIISLKFGYVDGKYFSSKSIADFLGIDENDVREVTKKVLLSYKENINNIIDNAIGVAIDEPNVLKKFNKNIKDN